MKPEFIADNPQFKTLTEFNTAKQSLISIPDNEEVLRHAIIFGYTNDRESEEYIINRLKQLKDLSLNTIFRFHKKEYMAEIKVLEQMQSNFEVSLKEQNEIKIKR